MKLKKNQHKVPGPPPKLSALDWRACGNFQHCLLVWAMDVYMQCIHMSHNVYHIRKKAASIFKSLNQYNKIYDNVKFNSLASERYGSNFKSVILKLNLMIYILNIFPVKWLPVEHHRTPLMTSQHWLRWWLGAITHQAISWINVNLVLCPLMASQGHNKLIYF